ncbi:MAG: hypothetical protein PWP67_2958 [Clostridium butyricum]|nr:hypothetical protein [Clostridium butyricum]
MYCTILFIVVNMQMEKIISFLKEIMNNYYKSSYILLNMLMIFFIEKYICNNEFPYFPNEMTKYIPSILSFLRFLVLTLFIYGTMEFVILIFYMLLISIKNLSNYIKKNAKYKLYKTYIALNYEDIYFKGLAEKILLSYSYMWIIIGYIFLFNKNEIILNVKNKSIFNIENLNIKIFEIAFFFILISLIIFIFIYIPLFVKFLMLPIHYEEFAKKYYEFFGKKRN